MRSIFGRVMGFFSSGEEEHVEESALPQPEHEADNGELRLHPHSMVFPAPLLRMPYEVDLAAPAEYVNHISAENLTRVSLPIYIRVEVFPPADNTECILLATLNRRGFGQGGDGLTAYGAVHRTDFSFRTRVFDFLPSDPQRHRRVKLHSRRWNEMSMVLSEQRATYWINGLRVASVILRNGDLPARELYVGCVSYDTPYGIRRFDVSRDPRMLQYVCAQQEISDLRLFKERIITVHGEIPESNAASSAHSSVAISCTNIGGDEVANFAAFPTTALLKDLRNMLEEKLHVGDFDDVKLVLRDGTLLQRVDDGMPILLAFHLPRS